jgi:hypothetical protein
MLSRPFGANSQAHKGQVLTLSTVGCIDATNILKDLCCLRNRPMFRRSPRQRASQASARVPTRHAGVRAPQWIQYFVGAAQKLNDIRMSILAQIFFW